MFKNLRKLDFSIIIAVVLLSAYGVILIHASVRSSATPSFAYFAFSDLWIRQLIYVITGLIIMLIFSQINFEFITRKYILVYIFVIFLLLLVLAVGADDGQAVSRWLVFPLPGGGSISMQPSELSKILIIVFLAALLSKWKDKLNKPLNLFFIMITIIIPFYLVTMQPSLSAAIVILSISLIVLFTAGLRIRTILISFAALTPLVIIAVYDLLLETPRIMTRFLSGFQLRRIQTFFNPVPGSDAFLQTEGSLYAITAGGFLGTGIYDGSHIIHGHNDFIFAIAAGRFGFLGGFILLAVTAFMIYRCLKIANESNNIQGKLIAAGVAGMLIVETFFHVGVVTNIIPNTGMPFPFVSYGGTMVWVHMAAIGIVLNIHIKNKQRVIT